MSHSSTAGKSTKPGLLPGLSLLLFRPRAPPLGEGPTSSKVSRGCQVGKVIQTDDIDDGAHDTCVVLGEEVQDGVRPGILCRKRLSHLIWGGLSGTHSSQCCFLPDIPGPPRPMSGCGKAPPASPRHKTAPVTSPPIILSPMGSLLLSEAITDAAG